MFSATVGLLVVKILSKDIGKGKTAIFGEVYQLHL